MLEDLSLRQLIDRPTRTTTSTSTLIDHILTSRPELTSNARVVNCNFSDHDLIAVDVLARRERSRPHTITARSTRNVDYNALNLELLMADWDSVYSAAPTSKKWDAWLQVWQPIIDRHMPLRTVRLKHPPSPWLHENEELRECMERRYRAREDRDLDRSNGEKQQAFRDSRNAVKRAQYKAYSEYFALSYRNQRAKTWTDIRRHLIASKRPEPRAAPLHQSDPAWAERLNRHFVAAGAEDRFKMRLCEDKRNPVRRTKLGKHPQKTLFIILERNNMTYVVQLFLPSILFILVAWLSILVPPTMLRTRLLLNSTNLLTVLSMFVAVSHAEATYIPKVSYLTALSLWMFVCVAFVFSSMLVVIFDIRLIAMLTQPAEKQRVRKLVLGVYQRRRSTRQGFQSVADLVEEEEAENASAAAAIERLRKMHKTSIKDEEGDIFMDASSQSVAAPDVAEKKEVEGRLRHRRHLWLELTAFYERMYLLAFPSLFTVFMVAFFWYYRRRKQLSLAHLLDVVRASDAEPRAPDAEPGCWCTDHDDWPGCMPQDQ
ncbi:Glycine receptor subunit alpha-3 [Amphibalanus amphitrite]|uniref:Glycine receptor subunit alpha-3 n=1 Tax=Amphibalanus amphitrite TaxID=1232801 RepID=A0A6A4WSJ0_AMPAM|nr:Glycine receptor subunit alpha-3 [Amphibalanus amphitrite]